MVLPLFAPGGVEVAIILLISLFLFSPIVALAYLVLFRPDREDDATADRVDELEAEVEQLRERLETADGREESGTLDADAPEGGDADSSNDESGRTAPDDD